MRTALLIGLVLVAGFSIIAMPVASASPQLPHVHGQSCGSGGTEIIITYWPNGEISTGCIQ